MISTQPCNRGTLQVRSGQCRLASRAPKTQHDQLEMAMVRGGCYCMPFCSSNGMLLETCSWGVAYMQHNHTLGNLSACQCPCKTRRAGNRVSPIKSSQAEQHFVKASTAAACQALTRAPTQGRMEYMPAAFSLQVID